MKSTHRTAASLALALAAGAAAAHTGHGTSSAYEGLVHPLGLDHLLAMVAVGLWSAAALQGRARLAGPALFMAALVAGATAGTAGLGGSLVETGIAASVVLMGVLLALARRLPVAQGLALIAAVGALHGLAHGAELPAGGGFAGYAAGFLATTALLHGAGLGLGRAVLGLQAWVWRVLATGVGGAGLLLLARV
jgi:urease accessory protein